MSLKVSTFAQASESFWLEAIKKCNLRLTRRKQPSRYAWSSSVALLPEDLQATDKYMTLFVHPVGEESEEVHWLLKLMPVPDDNPPPRVVEDSREMEGYQGLLGSLSECLRSLNPVSGRIDASWVITTQLWVPPKRRRTKLAPGEGLPLTERRVEWQAEGDKASLLSYSYPDKDGLWLLEFASSSMIEIGPHLFQRTDDDLWSKAKKYLAPRSSGS